MVKELLILRHGKSDWSAGVDDLHRPLNKRGRKAAQRMGAWIAQERLLPDHVISSPAVRATSTAKRVAAAACPGCAIQVEQALYAADVEVLQRVVTRLPADAARVLLVGHNPGLEELLEYLVGRIPLQEDGKILPTCALARVHLDGGWEQAVSGSARLLCITRPGDVSGR